MGDLSVADGEEACRVVVHGQLVDVHGSFVLLDQLAGLDAVEGDESSVVPAGCEQPVASRIELDLLDQTFQLIVFDRVELLAFLPVENLDARWASEVIDVSDLAYAASGQQL